VAQPAAPPEVPLPVASARQPLEPAVPRHDYLPPTGAPSTGAVGAQTHGATALERAVVPAQSRNEEAPGAQLDPRARQILIWLETEPTLTGADAARRLDTSLRTGQRLWRAAHDELKRRGTTGGRRLRSVGDPVGASSPAD
jgi:hypothetical protein